MLVCVILWKEKKWVMIIIKIRKKVGRKKISIGEVIEVLFIKLKIYMFVIFIGDC